MINLLVNKSDEIYKNKNNCAECINECPNTGDCEKCLANIHLGKTDRQYNCNNILHYYNCKYIFKYASEIGHLFTSDRLKLLDEYNVLSIGCGPCSDFLAIQYMIDNKPIKYYGIELNHDWQEIHNLIKTNYLQDVTFNYINAFTFLENPNEYLKDFTPNIIVINYLLSDLIKSHSDIKLFIELLNKNLFSNLLSNSFIIINDYNRGLNNNDPRFYYENFITEIKKDNTIESYKLHFKHDIKRYHKYRQEHQSNRLLFKIPGFCLRYNPWTFCSSAQLIIKKV